MTPNPYAPPRAEVGDPASRPPTSPAAVRRACLLVLASMALGWVTLLPGVSVTLPDDPTIPFVISLAIVAFFSALTIWLVLATGRGARWGRWALLAYLILGWVLTGMQLNDEFLRSPLSGMIEIVCVVIELAACGLLFFGSGARWFAELALARDPKKSGG